jgi:hypothetical protein
MNITYHLNLTFNTKRDRDIALKMLREYEEDEGFQSSMSATVFDKGLLVELLKDDESK